MYDNYRNPHPPGMQMPPPNLQPGPYDNPLYGASSGLIKTGLGVYGEKFLGSSSEFMQSNISRYFSNPQYYFHVNDQYVRNKLKVILFPFLHRGHWTRISWPVGGRLSYKPPMYDINAPDLYIPFMAFGTFIIADGGEEEGPSMDCNGRGQQHQHVVLKRKREDVAGMLDWVRGLAGSVSEEGTAAAGLADGYFSVALAAPEAVARKRARRSCALAATGCFIWSNHAFFPLEQNLAKSRCLFAG